MRWDTVDFVIRSAVRWCFRIRNAETGFFVAAIAVLIAIHGTNWIFKYSGPILGTPSSFEFGTVDSIPDGIIWSVTAVCALLMALSPVWAWKRYVNEQKRLSRKKVFIIEGRGLRDDDGSPLKTAVPDSIVGTQMDYLLDLRQRKDGCIVEPEDLSPNGKRNEDVVAPYTERK